MVIALRFAATFELARRILAGYQGLWAFAKRVLGIVGLSTVAYSLLIAQKKFSMMVLNLDRGVELAIATFVVSLLLFARYYVLPVESMDRALAIGLALYSCFYVINDTMFETLRKSFVNLWGYLDVLMFLASLLIWNHAVWAYSREISPGYKTEDFPQDAYATMSPVLNIRLKQLNDQVAQLLHVRKQSL